VINFFVGLLDTSDKPNILLEASWKRRKEEMLFVRI